MTIRLQRSRSAASTQQLTALEDLLGAPLPAEFRKFLLASDGAKPESNVLEIRGGENQVSVRQFFGVDEMRERSLRMRERLAPGLLPIADDGCGNLFCLDLATGAVCFFDHEEVGAAARVPLAPGFNAFVRSLRVQDPASVQLQPGQVKRVWVHPSLLLLSRKVSLLQELDVAMCARFGAHAFTAEGDKLGDNHIVYRSASVPRIEISVVAGGEGQAADRFSLQVEVDRGEPSYDVPLIVGDLDLEQVLAVLAKWRVRD